MADGVAVSVVVPAYRVADRIAATLDALAPQVREAGGEIVLVDDASPDDTALVAADWAADRPGVRCTVVRAHRRRGPNASRNAGVHHAVSDRLVFTDGDDVVRPGWLAALLGALAPDVIVSGCFVWPGDDTVRRVAPFFGLSTPVALGGSLAVRRDVFEATEGFDEVIVRGGTETEFVLRAGLTGRARVVTVPDAVIEYRLPPDRRGRRTRSVAQQRGFAVNARRVRAIPGAPRSAFTLGRRGRAALGAAARVVTGAGDGRVVASERLLTDVVGLAWIARCAVWCPPRRGFDPARIAGAYAVVAGPSSNAVPRG